MMFFSNSYVEAERRGNPVSEESDILRELLLENELASPHQFSSGSTKSVSSGKRSHVDISIPPICFESAQIQRLQPPPSIRGTPSLLHTPTGGHSLFFGSSSLSSSSLSSSLLHSSSTSSSSTPSSQIINAIISPPRVFIQEFARLPPPFFHDSILDNDNCDARPVKSIPSLSQCVPPPPPLLMMPPLKKKKCTAANPERKQLRCSYPNCPNLRRSAGFCNRHSGKVCSVGDCNKSALSRGKCPEHGGGSRCKRDGCAKFAQTRGLCKSHGGGRQCSVSGCSKNAHQNRLCRSHGGGKRCDYYGCPKWAQRSGYCCAHTKMGPASSSASGMTTASSSPPSSSTMSSTAVTPSSTTVSPHRLTSFPLLS